MFAVQLSHFLAEELFILGVATANGVCLLKKLVGGKLGSPLCGLQWWKSTMQVVKWKTPKPILEFNLDDLCDRI